MCTQAELDTLRSALTTVLTTGGITRIRAADGRDTQYGPANLAALRMEIRRVEDCLNQIAGKRVSRLMRFRYSKGLR